MSSESHTIETQAVHAGREDLTDAGVHALPIDLSTTNPLPDIETGGHSYETMATGGRQPSDGSAVYARLWNPTVARFESGLATMENAEAAVAFSSGMAGVSAALLAMCTGQNKAHVVAVRPLYGGTDHLLNTGMLGTETTYCAVDEVASAIREDTGLVILETPANPTLELVSISDVVEQAGSVPVLVDNTFATPVLQNPLDHGAAMSLHSATKYIGGHGDAVGGVIACSEQTAVQLRQIRAVTGGILHPMGAYLLHRGLATLPLRVHRAQETAQQVADWLSSHEEIDHVFYPRREDDPAGVLAAGEFAAGEFAAQMRGTGAMLAVRMSGGFAAAEQLTSGVRLFTHAVSLGGVDSLIQHPAALTHRPVAPEARPSADVVRLSIGLEAPEDLIADLRGALD